MQWAREEESSHTQRLVPLQEVMTREEGHYAQGGKSSIPQGQGPWRVQKQGHVAGVGVGWKSGREERICLESRTTVQLA